jgi:hypothetical protein
MGEVQNAFLDITDQIWFFDNDVINAFQIQQSAEVALAHTAEVVPDCNEETETDLDFGLGTSLFLVGLIGLVLWGLFKWKKQK